MKSKIIGKTAGFLNDSKRSSFIGIIKDVKKCINNPDFIILKPFDGKDKPYKIYVCLETSLKMSNSI